MAYFHKMKKNAKKEKAYRPGNCSLALESKALYISLETNQSLVAEKQRLPGKNREKKMEFQTIIFVANFQWSFTTTLETVKIIDGRDNQNNYSLK